ncbi:hypothetical protein J1N10_06070 [Carboxylicivirga sp. A043]|uniref:hypothetical protein n=1 Tax=Carboxylicivirga litoralis TaxID=2816963 RepID=UPI0021CB0172|nr:hypothetical protein [Carboxylicivirga sp. A043]MCU4155534.1 hypothetical protein [Carboxylicivirga sp. A043]
MQTIVITLFILAIVSFAIQLQLFRNRWLLWGWLFVVALFVYFMHHLAIDQSYKTFRATLTNSSVMMDFTVLQVIEAVGGLLVSIFLIRAHYNEPVKKFFRYSIYLPGIIIFPALFYLESIFFLQVHGIDFKSVALIVAIIAMVVLYILGWGFKALIPEFDLQLEMKFIVHLLQLIGGIILSVVMLRLPIHSAGQELSALPMLVLLFVALGGIISGLFWYRIKLKRFAKRQVAK